jgi:hypothetical protein
MDATILENFKAARREYERAKYRTDPKYRERIQVINRGRYKRITKNCADCNKRMKLEETVCRWCIEKKKRSMKAQHKNEIKEFIKSLDSVVPETENPLALEKPNDVQQKVDNQ